jgi:hypothetical protein
MSHKGKFGPNPKKEGFLSTIEKYAKELSPVKDIKYQV